MNYIENLLSKEATNYLMQELNCYIDTRRNEIHRLVDLTPEYAEMKATTEKLRDKLRALDEDLLEEFEIAMMIENCFISNHQYLQGVIDGMTFIDFFKGLDIRNKKTHKIFRFKSEPEYITCDHHSGPTHELLKREFNKIMNNGK